MIFKWRNKSGIHRKIFVESGDMGGLMSVHGPKIPGYDPPSLTVFVNGVNGRKLNVRLDFDSRKRGVVAPVGKHTHEVAEQVWLRGVRGHSAADEDLVVLLNVNAPNTFHIIWVRIPRQTHIFYPIVFVNNVITSIFG